VLLYGAECTKMNMEWMKLAIVWSGIGHFALCLGSLYIPKAMNWRSHLATLHPLLKQMFWTYAVYILVINLSFGIVSVFGSDELLNRTFLAKAITLLIGVYWLTRIGIQFFYFDRSQAPKGLIFLLGEFALVGLFAVFTVTYLTAFLINIEWL
jgi:hypothetical protein